MQLTHTNTNFVSINSLNLQVVVHPTVLLQVCDSFERRPKDKTRIIGTLLGKLEKDVVEVTNCFSVPYALHNINTSDQSDSKECKVDVHLQYAQEMVELNKRVSPTEQVVGWFATGHQISNSFSSFIHDYYSRQNKSCCVHLTIETSLTATNVDGNIGLGGGPNGTSSSDSFYAPQDGSVGGGSKKINVRAHVLEAMGVPGGSVRSTFSRIPVHVTSYESERIGANLLQLTKYNKMRQVEIPHDMTKISDGLNKITSMLQIVIEYVESVVSGEQVGDNIVGRKLLQLVNSTPKLDMAKFESILNSNIKDSLMVSYLMKMVQTQLQINEKVAVISVNQLAEYQKLLPE